MTDPLEVWHGTAEWHEHFFALDGGWWPHEAGDPEVDMRNEYIGRYDAVEDDRGRIFVWRAEDYGIVEFCATREEACAKAKARATWKLSR